jgi:TolA-binding protein
MFTVAGRVALLSMMTCLLAYSAPVVGQDAPDQPEGGSGKAQQVPDAQRQKLQARARQRAALDAKKYSRDQLREAEELYQVANKNWRTDEAKQSLEQMVKKFPNINRTGCAVLYLAQFSRGEEQERLLKQAIQKHGDCFYFDGVQVGAFARLLLGQYYQQNGQPEKAKPLFAEIRAKFPDSIDHRGESLVAKLPKE